jgi:hypothetical protein
MISDVGWGAYVDLSNSSLNMTLIAANASLADTNATLLPFVNYIDEATGGQVQVSTAPIGSFYELYLDSFIDTDGAGGFQVELASRLLPRSLAETDPAKAAKIMLSLDGGVVMK